MGGLAPQPGLWYEELLVRSVGLCVLRVVLPLHHIIIVALMFTHYCRRKSPMSLLRLKRTLPLPKTFSRFFCAGFTACEEPVVCSTQTFHSICWAKGFNRASSERYVFMSFSSTSCKLPRFNSTRQMIFLLLFCSAYRIIQSHILPCKFKFLRKSHRFP